MEILSAKKLTILPLIKNDAKFSSCETDFSRRSSLTIENYDVLTMLEVEASLVVEVEESIAVEKL